MVSVAGLKFDQLLSRSKSGDANSQRSPRFTVSFGRHTPVVLDIKRMDVLPQIDDRIAAQVDAAGQAEDEIRQVVAGGVGRDRASRGLT